MRRLLHILDFADSHPTPCAVFSLDAEKAFDRLEWNYMWAVLQCFGFGEHFVSMIKTLYHSPAASVITGNIISPLFPLQRGTRQGCPLSPLLFCLSLEPLAQAIRKSEVSIKIHDHNHSISLYADDIILYLDHFDVSVSSIINRLVGRLYVLTQFALPSFFGTQRRRSHFSLPVLALIFPACSLVSCLVILERLSLHCSPKLEKIMDLINWSLNAIDTIFSTRSSGSGEPDCPDGTFAAGYTMDTWDR